MPLDASQLVRAAWRSALAPDPMLSVAGWADRHRVLSSVASAEPGRWSTARTPYLKEVMEALSPASRIERVVLMAGAQVGKTECGLNWIGFVIHHAPGPMLMVEPSLETMKRVSRQRIDALIESTPALAERVKDPRSRDAGNTLLMKEFAGGVLIMTGANSAVGLRSMPVRYLFLDEVDGYPGDADGEGDPVELAIQRTVTFRRRKIYLCSTPTIKGLSRIERAWQESDRRVYELPCDGCGRFSELAWRDIVWPEGAPEEAAWRCPQCGALHSHWRKPALLAAGRWRATAQGDGRTAGFHLSSLYSPWLSWGEIARDFLASKDDPARLKVWVNTRLAQAWEDRLDEGLDPTGLLARREDFGLEPIPREVAVLTCGVDVQADRLELELVGWGRDEESWSLDYRVLWGDPSAPAVWQDLDAYLGRRFAHARLPQGLTIEAACIDTGGHHTLAAYEFCRGKERRRIFAIKGAAGNRPIWPRRPGRAYKGRLNLFTVGVDAAKETIYARLPKAPPGPGTMHFPLARDLVYFEQLTAERCITRYVKGHPKREWIKDGARRNEALDCRVYAYCALHALIAMGLRLNERVAQSDAAQAPPTDAPTKTRRRAIRSTYL
ncbi:MAG: phage terminase large subunit family protein [Rhodocyclaceae bacterium]|nr:phage terminase large subunit family protein [Rhodocyclaceae bacterium]